MAKMQDITKLKTVANYASDKKCSVQNIYQLLGNNKLKKIVIDGVIFVKTS